MRRVTLSQLATVKDLPVKAALAEIERASADNNGAFGNELGGADTVAEAQALLAQALIRVRITVDFGVAGDNAITIALPEGYSRWRWDSGILSGASANISGATFGIFPSPAGAGTALVAAGTAITVTSAAENTNNNMQLVTAANQNTLSHNQTTIYFRVGTTTTGTATFSLDVQPVS